MAGEGLALQEFSLDSFQTVVKHSHDDSNTKIAQTWRSVLKLDTLTEPPTTQIKIKLKEPCVQAFREAFCKVDSLSWLGWAPRIQAAPRESVWRLWQVDCLDGNENFAGHLSTRHQGERSTWSTADTSSDFFIFKGLYLLRDGDEPWGQRFGRENRFISIQIMRNIHTAIRLLWKRSQSYPFFQYSPLLVPLRLSVVTFLLCLLTMEESDDYSPRWHGYRAPSKSKNVPLLLTSPNCCICVYFT